MAGDDIEALTLLAETSDLNLPHALRHYLYFPRREDAPDVVRELANRGFRTESRLGADGVNWLILAKHTEVPTYELIAATRSLMTELMLKIGGEYDGWEAALPQDEVLLQ